MTDNQDKTAADPNKVDAIKLVWTPPGTQGPISV